MLMAREGEIEHDAGTREGSIFSFGVLSGRLLN